MAFAIVPANQALRIGNLGRIRLFVLNTSNGVETVFSPYTESNYELIVIEKSSGKRLAAMLPAGADIGGDVVGTRICPGSYFQWDLHIANFVKIPSPGTYTFQVQSTTLYRTDIKSTVNLRSNTVAISVLP